MLVARNGSTKALMKRAEVERKQMTRKPIGGWCLNIEERGGETAGKEGEGVHKYGGSARAFMWAFACSSHCRVALVLHQVATMSSGKKAETT